MNSLVDAYDKPKCFPCRAIVHVKKVGKNKFKIVPSELMVSKPSTLWARLADKVQILCPDSEEVVNPSPGKCFYGTTETLDPIHAIMEM